MPNSILFRAFIKFLHHTMHINDTNLKKKINTKNLNIIYDITIIFKSQLFFFLQKRVMLYLIVSIRGFILRFLSKSMKIH